MCYCDYYMWCTICIAMYTFVDGQWDYEVHNDPDFTITVQDVDGVMNTISPCGVDDSRTLWACVCVHWEMWQSSMTKSSKDTHYPPQLCISATGDRHNVTDHTLMEHKLCTYIPRLNWLVAFFLLGTISKD